MVGIATYGDCLTPGSAAAEALAGTPGGDLAAMCLLPGCAAAPLAERVWGREGVEQAAAAWPSSLAALQARPAAGSWAELAAAAAARRASHLDRGRLHGLAAEQSAAAGQLVEALYSAAEGHRLLGGGGAASQPASGGGTELGSSGCAGWWQQRVSHLASASQLGRLYEMAGLADEAVHTLTEGQRLVRSCLTRGIIDQTTKIAETRHTPVAVRCLQAAGMGAHALAGWFAAQLALIYLNQGRPEPAAAAADVAGRLLDAGSEGSDAGLGDHLARATCLRAAARLAWQVGGPSDGGNDAGLQLCQDALAACQQAATLAGAGAHPPAAAAEVAACAAAAHLAAAEQLVAAQGGVAVALGHARQALAGLEACGTGCSTSTARYCRIAALLFLGLHGAAPLQQPQLDLRVWGLGTEAAAGSATTAAPAAMAGRRAPAKGRAPRGKAAVAATAAAEEEASGGPAASEEAALWQVLAQSGELPGPSRAAAAELARACGQRGQLHLAAVLLQASLGATMRLQHRLVAHSKAQQAQRGGQGGRPSQEAAHLDLLTSGLDWGVVEELGGLATAAGDAGPSARASAPARGRGAQRAQEAAAPALDAGRRQACLAALEAQAQAALQRWLAALPAGTAVCSVSPRLSRREGGPPPALLVCRLAPGGAGPPLVVELSVPGMEASLSQHPIRALCMDVEMADASAGRQCG